MINANELRIGNWVSVHGNTQKITLISAGEIRTDWGYPENIFEETYIDPIPLTTEILEKAGFESGGHYNQLWLYLPDRTISLVYRRDNKSISFVNDDSDNFPYVSRVELNHIQFLHQVQNLYFALTGEELPINLEDISK